MNFNQLVDSISDDTNIPAKVVEAVLRAEQHTITEVVSGGGDIAIRGFGKFAASHRKQRQGRNPITGLPMTIPASSSIMFKGQKI
jgi:DNA-binding protein HU-beta